MSEAVFICSKRTLEFKGNGDDKLIIPRGYVGSVLEWVTKTWLYKAACKDGTITFVGRSGNHPGSNAEVDAETLALYERAKELDIRNYKNMKPETLKAKIEAAEAGDKDSTKES